MKYGPPRSLKLREQMVNATHSAAPSAYTLHSAVTFTVLPCPCGSLCESLPANVPTQAPTLSATLLCAALLPEPHAAPRPIESGRLIHQHRRKGVPYLRRASVFVRAQGVSPARCSYPFRRWRIGRDEKPLPRLDSSPHRR